jgi:hypothetical protein
MSTSLDALRPSVNPRSPQTSPPASRCHPSSRMPLRCTYARCPRHAHPLRAPHVPRPSSCRIALRRAAPRYPRLPHSPLLTRVCFTIACVPPPHPETRLCRLAILTHAAPSTSVLLPIPRTLHTCTTPSMSAFSSVLSALSLPTQLIY